MKKIGKSVIIIGTLLTTIGIGNLFINNKVDAAEIKKQYTYNPNNILDNTYTLNGEKILPFIFESADKNISISYIKEQFAKKDREVKNISTSEIVTATKIVADGTTYTVLIYGDVNSDGYVDMFDAQAISDHYIFGGENTIKGINLISANVENSDNEVDMFDAQRIADFFLGFEDKLIIKEPAVEGEKDKDKQAPVIYLKGADPQILKVGQTYTELGATVKDNIDKDIKVKIDASKVNTQKPGIYTVTYNAQDRSGNKAAEVKRKVVVEDYIKTIKLKSEPTKVTYQYNDSIDVNGGKIEIIYASGATKEIDIENSMIKGYDATKTSKQIITVSYTTKDTLNNKEETFEVFFIVEVKNYIENIEIVKLPDDTNYIEGEAILIDGMVINAININGEKTPISLLDENLKITPEKATLGNNIVTVSYTTNNTKNYEQKTFSKTFEIFVTKQPVNLIVTEKTTKGYKYETLEIATISSGENAQIIDLDKLSLEIKNGNEIITDENIAKVNANKVGENITLTFVSSKIGTYSITPKLEGTIGKSINVTIEENTEINKITLGEVAANFRIEQTRVIPVEFFHNYEGKEEVSIAVKANEIETTQQGMEVELLTETKDTINVTESPNAIVKYIYIKATESGEKTLTLKVNNCTKTITITILEKAKTEVKVGNITDITLYLEKPADNNMVKEDNGYIYTLIPIYLEDEDGNKTKLKEKDIKQLDENNGKVSIIDNMIDVVPEEIPCIVLQGYKIDGNSIVKVSTDSDEMNYIGIAVEPGEEEYIRNGYIKIFNDEMEEPIKLNIIMPLKEVANLVVTSKTEKGYKYETLEVANITSGENEGIIDLDKLSFEIKNGNETITDENIAKVEAQLNQFDGSIKVTFVSSKIGTYTITPKLNGVAGTVINVTIEENKEINKITLGEVAANFRIEQTRVIPVEFFHNYEGKEEVSIEVKANKIELTTQQGIEVELLTESEDKINVTESPNAIVKYIHIKATESGEKTLTLKVDNHTETKTITILEKAKTEVKVGDITDITLYLENQADNNMVKEDNGYIYTLISIYLEDEDGNKTKLKEKDIKQLDENNGKVSIIDNMIDVVPEEIPCIVLQGYKIDGNSIVKVSTDSDEMDYIGIAIEPGEEEYIRNGYIKIFNDEMEEPIKLNIIMPLKEVANLVVTSKTEKGYKYETLEVANITSGENEGIIDLDKLSFEIKKGNEIITDENIAKVEAEPNQFDGSIKVTFVSSKIGTYSITPKLDGVAGTAINVTIEENKEINKITLGEVAANFRIEQTRVIPVEFFHNYEGKEEVSIEVKANKIELTTQQGIEVELLTESEDKINVTESPNAIVKYIHIKAIESGEKTLTLKVDNYTETKTITILEKAKTEVKVGDITDITLYLENQVDNNMVKQDNGYIYTLLSIYLEDEDGNKTKLKEKDIKQLNEENGKVSIIDNMLDADPEEIPCIVLQGYKIDGNSIVKVSTDSDEMDYIGIAIEPGEEEYIKNGYIKIFNNEMANAIKLNVLIQDTNS